MRLGSSCGECSSWRRPLHTAIQEFTKRPSQASTSKYNPHHVVQPSSLTLQQCLEFSDVVIGAVPVASYKIKTDWLKDGVVAVNVAQEKNFEADVREKVGDVSEMAARDTDAVADVDSITPRGTGLHLCPIRRADDDRDAPAQPAATQKVQGNDCGESGERVLRRELM